MRNRGIDDPPALPPRNSSATLNQRKSDTSSLSSRNIPPPPSRPLPTLPRQHSRSLDNILNPGAGYEEPVRRSIDSTGPIVTLEVPVVNTRRHSQDSFLNEISKVIAKGNNKTPDDRPRTSKNGSIVPPPRPPRPNFRQETKPPVPPHKR